MYDSKQKMYFDEDKPTLFLLTNVHTNVSKTHTFFYVSSIDVYPITLNCKRNK